MKTELILYKQRLENNGDFNIIPDYGWTFTGTVPLDWEIDKQKITKIPGSGRILYQDDILVVGRAYRVRFNVSGRTAGSAAFKCKSGGATVVSIGVNGLFDYTFTADGTSLYFDVGSTFDGSFSKFSITEYPDIYNIDLYDDVSIPLTFSIDDIFNIGKRKTTYSKTVRIPGTKNNNIAFDHVFEINSEALYIPTKISRCLLFNDGIQVFDGSLSIENIVKTIKDNTEEIEYEITLLGFLTDIFENLGNKTIKDLDFARWDHDFSFANIMKANGMQGSSPWLPSVVDNSNSPSTYYNTQTLDYSKTAASITSYFFEGYNRVQINFSTAHTFEAGDEVYCITENNLLSGTQTIVFTAGNNIVLNMLYSNLTVTSITNLVVQRRIWKGEGYYYPMCDNGSFMRECVNGDKTEWNGNTNGQLTNDQLYTVKFLSTADDFSNLAVDPVTGAPITVVEGTTFRCDDGGGSGVAATANFWASGSILLTHDNPYYGGKPYYKQLFPNHWFIADFIPHIFVKEVWDKTMQLINYYYNSNELSGNLFRRLIMPLDQSFNPYLDIPGYTIYANRYVFMNDWLPNVKLSDFIKSILNIYNLVIIQDPEQSNLINLVCRSDFFNGDTFNLTPDISKPIEMKLSNSYLPKGYQIKYKDSEDFFNLDYNKDFGNVNNSNGIQNTIDRKYGDLYIDTGNQKSTEPNVTELVFAPTVMAGNLPGVYDTFNPGQGQDKVFSACFKADEFGNNASRYVTPRILIAGMRGTNYAYSLTGALNEDTNDFDVTESAITGYGNRWYPTAMHIDNIFDPVPYYDLNFGNLLGQYFPQTFDSDEWFYQTMGGIYWNKYLLDITNVNGKVITGTFRFSITDIYNLDFRDVYVFKNYTMKLNKIMDWDVNGDGFAKCEFTLKNL